LSVLLQLAFKVRALCTNGGFGEATPHLWQAQ
jgi:hypothetical protein